MKIRIIRFYILCQLSLTSRKSTEAHEITFSRVRTVCNPGKWNLTIMISFSHSAFPATLASRQ